MLICYYERYILGVLRSAQRQSYFSRQLFVLLKNITSVMSTSVQEVKYKHKINYKNVRKYKSRKIHLYYIFQFCIIVYITRAKDAWQEFFSTQVLHFSGLTLHTHTHEKVTAVMSFALVFTREHTSRSIFRHKFLAAVLL